MDKKELLEQIPYFKGKVSTHSFDCLTGVLNRESIFGYIDWLIQHKHTFSLFLIDEEFKKQNIYSTVYCKISAYGKDYGFIRVDTVNTARIWQNTEIAMLMYAANTIGILLHYQKKTLGELPLTATEIVGAETD